MKTQGINIVRLKRVLNNKGEEVLIMDKGHFVF